MYIAPLTRQSAPVFCAEDAIFRRCVRFATVAIFQACPMQKSEANCRAASCPFRKLHPRSMANCSSWASRSRSPRFRSTWCLGGIAHCRPGRRSFATTWRGLLAPAMHAGACIPCAPPRRLKATSVISRDCMHLLRCQLPRDRAHLLADVVLAHALSEGQQLAFDTVTGGAWRDAACGRLDGYTRVRQIPERAQEGRDAARPSAAS